MEPNQYQTAPPRPWFERNGFAPWVVAFVWVILSFILFQFAGLLFSVLGIWINPDIELNAQAMERIGEQMGMLFWANTMSQILVLGVGTWYFARLSVQPHRQREFFRFKAPGGALTIGALTIVVIIVMQPIIWLLTWLNMQIPVPETLSAFEQDQMDMIENFLTGDHLLMLTLIHVALVPAVCEEVLYRGYILRLLERSWGVWAAIIMCGVIFGLYHLRITQFVPLAVIGILLAWVTIKSGSIIPAIIGHFFNNAGSVIAASVRPELMFEEEITAELPSVNLVLISIVMTATVCFLIHNIAKTSTPKEGPL